MNQTLNLLRIMKIKGNVQNDVNDMYQPIGSILCHK